MTGETTPELSPLKRALLAIDDLRARLAAAEQARSAPIAIVGMGCRFPGAASPDELWDLLCAGIDAVADIPADRWDIDEYFDPDPLAPGKMSHRGGGFLDDVRGFDPAFFGITPREAVSMDPQQRLLLEVAWEALEHAAIAPDRLAGSRTGVFVGTATNDYAQVHLEASGLAGLDAYHATGTAHSITSGRLSYVLGLRGPAISIDTACSSSLVAIHLAVQSLRAGETDLALAGGVNLILSPDNSITLSKYQMLAPDSRCKAFDAAADGFGRGEGCGVVVLKRLDQARRDGDRVLAVIRGSAANQDGASSGLTAPNGPSQEAVLRDALADAGVAPASIGYVEAHGTGTVLGDPIEAQAIAAVLGEGRASDSPVAIGSVKTNLAHLECAAGVAALIKTVLALQHAEIPPHLHLHEPSPHIDWDALPLVIPIERTPWPGGGPRRAGVSAFGFSGTNVHVVLEAAPEPEGGSAAPPAANLLALSARSASALGELARRYAARLVAEPALTLADVCRTANVGRAHLDHRAAFVAGSRDELLAQLEAFAATGAAAPGVVVGTPREGDAPRVAFLYTGQGSQWAGMGRELYAAEPVFRAAVDRCLAVLDGIDVAGVPGWAGPAVVELREVMFADADDPIAGLLDQTAVTQPALFVLEYALAELWRAWGVEPVALIGHSVGEIAAAVTAGVLSPEDGTRMAAARGRLMQRLPAGGSMTAVFATPAEVDAAVAELRSTGVGGVLGVAAVNGPAHVVVSGDAELVTQLAESFAARGARTQPLAVSHAFHSARVRPMLPEFRETLDAFALSSPTKRVISNVTGAPIGRELADRDYWVRHVEAPVRFADGIAALHTLDIDVFVEVGPHPVLLGMARECPERAGASAANWIASLRRRRPGVDSVLGALAAVYAAGGDVDWSAFAAARGGRRVGLPTYPFERQEYWVTGSRRRRSAVGVHPLLGSRVDSPLRPVVFAGEVAADAQAYLDDHRVFDRAILPATAFLEAAAAGVALLGGQAPPGDMTPGDVTAGDVTLADVVVHQALVVDGDEPHAMQTVFDPAGPDTTFEIFSRGDGGEWTRHVSGRSIAPAPIAAEPLDAVRARCAETITPVAHYARLAERGLAFGPSLRGLVGIAAGAGEAVGRLELPAEQAGEAPHYRVHPALLDAAIQVLATVTRESDDTYLPFNIDSVSLVGAAGTRGWSHARLRAGTDLAARPELITADVVLYDDAERAVGRVDGLHLKRADQAALLRLGHRDPTAEWLYEVVWDVLDAAPGASCDDVPLAVGVAEVAAAASAVLEQRAGEHEIVGYQGLLDALEQASTGYIVAALAELGVTPAVGAQFTATQLAVAPEHRRLADHLLDLLVGDGVLAADDTHFRFVTVPPRPPDDAGWDALAATYPRGLGEMAITRRCGESLAAALAGRVDPLDLLFPAGSLESAEQMYAVSPFAHFYNSLAAEAVAEVVAGVPVDRHLRVLEIGAGTGGTTGYVLPRLPADRTSYTYTDVSPHFLVRARDKFAAYPFVEYTTLDIEADPAEQGFAAGQYDVVVAANVLHATADLDVTFANVAQLLAPGGVLVMVEMVVPLRYIAISFGLTPGWWKFTDTDVRPDSLLLGAEAWRRFLTGAGFADPVTIPGGSAHAVASDSTSGTPATTTIQAVVVAGAPAHAGQTALGAWLVIGDADGSAADVVAALRERGAPAQLAAADRVADALADPPSARGWAGVVDVSALDGAHATSAAALERSLGGALGVAQALVAGRPLPLVLVTRGAQSVRGDTPDPGQAPLWGLGRVLALEHPELHCRRVDLDPAAGAPYIPELLDELGRPVQHLAGGIEVAWRAGVRYTTRLARCGDVDPPAEPHPVALELSSHGVLDELTVVPARRRPPGSGEIEILVRAAGLNFRDVMNALAMRDDQEPIGSECAGTVVAVGPDVDGVAVGDAVMGVAPGSFATYVTTRAELVVPKPAALTFQQAAAIPLAFLTAVDALETGAHLQPGEHVLVHAAAGGVGLAAIQVARRAGAHVLATAGSEHKRRAVRALGVDHVADSRSTTFTADVRAATAGRGVDVVLNSLTGPAIEAGLRSLAPGGRFVELGKREVWRPAEVAAVNDAARYLTIRLAERIVEEPAAVGAQLRAITADLVAGVLTPLPVQTFLLSDAAAAFRTMAQARHVGKVVLVPDGAREARVAPPRARPGATYLVTGGLAGLGLLVAEWLVAAGADHVALLGRHAPGEQARQAIERMRARGARVLAVQADVGDDARLATVLDEIDATMPSLCGVFHCAGVLDDAALPRQDWQRFARVLHPKVDGAAALDRLTAGRELDHFVLFSSVAAVVGSRGQANHAAANSFLDALAVARRDLGRCGLSINWGGWSGVGSVETQAVGARLEASGIGLMTPEQGLRALDRALGQGRPGISVLPIDWGRYAATLGGAVPPMFAGLATAPSRPVAADASRATSVGLTDRLAEVAPAERFDAILDFVREQAARVIGAATPSAVDERKPLNELGLDSLMAVELRNLLGEAVGFSLPATLVFDHPTVAALARHLDTLLSGDDGGTDGSPAPAGPPVGDADDLLASIEQMTDAEVAELLDESGPSLTPPSDRSGGDER